MLIIYKNLACMTSEGLTMPGELRVTSVWFQKSPTKIPKHCLEMILRSICYVMYVLLATYQKETHLNWNWSAGQILTHTVSSQSDILCVVPPDPKLNKYLFSTFLNFRSGDKTQTAPSISLRRLQSEKCLLMLHQPISLCFTGTSLPAQA